ncbi:hypothetical protein ACH5RR_012144 [Cinchona calisaya]|uniref:Uncharacterized protein n=1 Tax=Cinchona calisaya TaxID=153742 RepID=A0ABD3A7H0_9GENT
MDTSRLDLFIATRMTKNRILLDDDTKTLFENIKERLSQVPEANQTRALKEHVFIGVVTQEGHGRMLCLGRGANLIELQCTSTPTPITLDSRSEEVLQILIQKVEENLQSKVRAEAEAKVISALENFFTTFVPEANQAPDMTLRGEYNVNIQVTDTSSKHQVEISSSGDENLENQQENDIKIKEKPFVDTSMKSGTLS